MVVKSNLLQLKIKEGTEFYKFLEWFEKSKATINDTGRNRKGNYKKFIIDEFESMLSGGEPTQEFLETISEYKNSIPLSDEMLGMKKVMGDIEFEKFYKKTGCPLIVNTSFNVRGEPVVCSPSDAFKCFMGTGLDLLAIGNFLLYKSEQDKNLQNSYKDHYELD